MLTKKQANETLRNIHGMAIRHWVTGLAVLCGHQTPGAAILNLTAAQDAGISFRLSDGYVNALETGMVCAGLNPYHRGSRKGVDANPSI